MRLSTMIYHTIFLSHNVCFIQPPLPACQQQLRHAADRWGQQLHPLAVKCFVAPWTHLSLRWTCELQQLQKLCLFWVMCSFVNVSHFAMLENQFFSHGHVIFFSCKLASQLRIFLRTGRISLNINWNVKCSFASGVSAHKTVFFFSNF